MAGSSFSRTRSHYAQTYILQPNHSWIFSTGTDAPDKKAARTGPPSRTGRCPGHARRILRSLAQYRRQDQLREKTYGDYEAMLYRYIRPYLGAREIAVLAPMDIQNTYRYMIEAGLSSRTVRYVHSVLRSALNQAVRWQLVTTAPTSGVLLPREKNREMRVLNKEQACLFLKTAMTKEYGVIFALP